MIALSQKTVDTMKHNNNKGHFDRNNKQMEKAP